MRVYKASICGTPVNPRLVENRVSSELDFPRHLAWLRKERGVIQQALAGLVGIHISQLRRYESGQSQPTLDAIRKLAPAFSVSADMLLFARDERGPDDDFKLQFEAASRLNPDEKNVIRSVIETSSCATPSSRLSAASPPPIQEGLPDERYP